MIDSHYFKEIFSKELNAPNCSVEKIENLQTRAKLISNLCEEINPYSELSKDARDLLFFLGIVDYYDPFAITKELLLLLEETNEKLYKKNIQ
jgi:hypothetical protein